MELENTLPTSADYTSGRVRVSLEWPDRISSACTIEQRNDPTQRFWLEDILFMAGKFVSLALPPGQTISSEADVQAWFNTVADIPRSHGASLLAGQPGAFARLAETSAERERLIIEECERLAGIAPPAPG